MSKKTIHVDAEIEVPRCPNFVFYANDGRHTNQIDIADIPDADLKKLGLAWVEQLLYFAAERRKSKKLSVAAERHKGRF